MYGKKVLFALIAVILVVGITTSSADASVDTSWPSCGEKVVIGYATYEHDNLTISFEDVDGENPDLYTVHSANGWIFYQLIIDDGQDELVIESFPDGKTTYSIPSSVRIRSIKVSLKKDCDYTPVCKSTSTYVYTLLGNYPCNLLTIEKPMPERFRNPEYINALCALPDKQFNWNGTWVKNTVVTCESYEIGGQFYDTRY